MKGTDGFLSRFKLQLKADRVAEELGVFLACEPACEVRSLVLPAVAQVHGLESREGVEPRHLLGHG